MIAVIIHPEPCTRIHLALNLISWQILQTLNGAKQNIHALMAHTSSIPFVEYYIYILSMGNLFFALAMNLIDSIFFSVAPRLGFLRIVIVAALAALLLTLPQLINATLTAIWVALFALIVVLHFLR